MPEAPLLRRCRHGSIRGRSTTGTASSLSDGGVRVPYNWVRSVPLGWGFSAMLGPSGGGGGGMSLACGTVEKGSG